MLSNLSSHWIRTLGLITGFVICAIGCEKENVPCDDPVVSTISFNYSGARTGTYISTGEYVAYDAQQNPNNPFNSEWATADVFADYGQWLGIYGNMRISSQSFDRIQFSVKEGKTGRFQLPSDRGGDVISFNLRPSLLDSDSFEFSQGEVIITYYRCGRVKGTFSGEATQEYNMKPIRKIIIAGGTFDIALQP